MPHSPTFPAHDAFEAISRFLAAPPAGTPAEILDALQGGSALPPRLFLETVEQAPVAISITDASARILYANAAFEALTGYNRREVIGKNESVLSSRSTPAEVYRDLWQTIQARRVWHGHLVNHRENGEEYLAELTVSPVLDASGGVAYYLGMHRDVSERHQLEQRLKFHKALTEAALDAAPVLVAMLDAERGVLLGNQAYKKLAAELGAEPASLLLDSLAPEVGELCQVCHAGQGFSNREVRIDSPAGPRWFSCAGARVAELGEAARNYFQEDENPRCYLLLTANDITAARQRIQDARMNLIRQSMAEEQMRQTMHEAISAAIFKLQAPLNIIKAALALPPSTSSGGGPLTGSPSTSSGNGGDTSLRRVLSQALEMGSEALRSLEYALPAPVSEQSGVVNLNEILHEVLKLSTSALLANGIVVDWRPAPVLPHLIGQAGALRRLFKYLLDNAVQAVSEQRGEREIRLQTSLQEQEILVEIMDNGPGVAASERLKIFEPFFCGWKHPRGHAGMGLSMAREIALNHGGTIENDPDFLGGCRFQARLPLRGAEASHE